MSKAAYHILEELEKRNLINSIVLLNNFPDEPQFYTYDCELKNTQKYSDGVITSVSSSGFSSESKDLALIKCLGEAAERLCNIAYKKKDIIYSTYNSQGSFLDPVLFTENIKTRASKIGWVKGFNILDGNNYFIPAQAIYFNYRKDAGEPFLTTAISTGAAGALKKDEALLKGIYEVVERDSFMCSYLLKINRGKVDFDKIIDSRILKIVDSCKRYRLEVLTIDITSDIEIPSFLSFIIDNTGLGPPLSLGLKTSLDPNEAILGSIEEAVKGRPWMRVKLFNSILIKEKSSKPITNIDERGEFWLDHKKMAKLDFYLKQNKKTSLKEYLKPILKKELKTTIKMLNDKGYEIFYKDITLPFFTRIGFFVYKVTIPKLQPLYLNENFPEFRKSRLKTVANSFNISYKSLNTYTHPFL